MYFTQGGGLSKSSHLTENFLLVFKFIQIVLNLNLFLKMYVHTDCVHL